MNLDFELLLFVFLILTGVVALIDVVFLAGRRHRAGNKKMPLASEYARSFFPVILLVFSFRSFAYEPRRIPSGSLKPTLLVGDFIVVNKYAYGLRLPVFHNKIVSIGEPQRGDIVVFRRPTKQPLDLIKRVVGVPGDHISYIDKVLYINGEKIPQTFYKMTNDADDDDPAWPVKQMHENLLGVTHDMYRKLDIPADDFHDVVVPEGKYFMMGDNRDSSADSRYWGFMPEENIIGKATYVGVSFDKLSHPVRWERVGKKLI